MTNPSEEERVSQKESEPPPTTAAERKKWLEFIAEEGYGIVQARPRMATQFLVRLIADVERLTKADPALFAALVDIVNEVPPDLHDMECLVVGEDIRCIEDCRVANARAAIAKAKGSE